MRNTILYCLLLLTVFTSAQNKEEITLKNGSKILVGHITVEDLKTEPYLSWFDSNYKNYTVESEKTESFSASLKEYHLLLFMGTWCVDSKREVPRIIKILETVNFPMEQLKIVAVDKREAFYKKSPGGEEWGLYIHWVPTLIFLKKGREINRIIESPMISLEDDFSAIINGNQYDPY